ncbi:MAG TPA: surface-adhesin E family protein [Steroidobacteraceae bacterium]|nr:surface-adhesin E family protein [Steroidobacteraceae bacterium]
MRALAVPLVGAVLIFALHDARGATACPPPSIAGSPNALTTSRPVSSAPSTRARCIKPAPSAATVAVSAVTASPPAAPVATTWKSVLDPLSKGGWAYITDGPPENPSAVYASSHSVVHDGNVVTAWMRWEFSRPQAEVYPLKYLSAVTREELDCDARSYRRSAVIYYIRNNLQEKGPSFTALDDDTTWKQAIPGTEADAMLNWGCAPPAKVKTVTPAATEKSAKASKASAAPAAPSSAPSSAPGALPNVATEVHTVR